MAEVTEGEETGEFDGEIEHLSPQILGYPRDLLQRFTSVSYLSGDSPAETEESGEIELNLGLSLGGCFGVDTKDTMLVRSSSVAGITTLGEDDDVAVPWTSMATTALTRTWSVPAETEEERRKRKETQSMRRMEAKRKRSEKQRSFLGFKDREEVDKQGEEDRLLGMTIKVKVEGGDGSDFSGSTVEKKNHQSSVTNGVSTSSCAGTGTGTGVVAMAPFVRFSPSSQGSLGSQGSSSSGVSDIGNRSVTGLSYCTDGRHLSRAQSLPETFDQKAAIIAHVAKSIAQKSGKSAKEEVKYDESNKSMIINNGLVRNVMEDMPCVSTRGDGPNGRKIEGFLYKYKNGEEVSIVCVCHGSFLSPAEFVRHAGGGDVAHPLRHIVVNPSPFL